MNGDPLGPPPPGQPPPDPYASSIAYMPQRQMELDPMMSKHLDASEMLLRLKHMLLGHEYDEEAEEWQTIMNIVGKDEKGNNIEVAAEPLIPERTVRSIIGSLEMYLSSNTFLSVLKEEARNDIMWGICQNLGVIWFRLGNRIAPEERAMIHSTIKDAIFLGLSRAENKNTLDAVSKMQQSHEIIQAHPKTPTPGEKEFKILGW